MSNILFKNIIIHHFMSYEHVELDLDRSGYIFISGDNNNDIDNAKSNGSGKSSLFSALCWCLTGETPSGNKKVENIYLTGETYVEVNFYINDDKYTIKRTKNPSNLFIHINGENKSGKGIRDTTELLSEYLPDITSSLINSVIILGQGLPKRFTNNTPSGRKEILEKLSNSDFMILDIKDKISKRKDKLDVRLSEIQNNITKTETELNILRESISNNCKKLESINISSLEFELDRLKSKSIEIEKDIEIYNSVKFECQTQLDSLTADIQKIGDLYDDEVKNLDLIDPKELQDDFSYIVEQKTKLKYKQDEIKKLDSIIDICPTCGQKLPNVQKIDTSNIKVECENLILEIESLESELNSKKEYNNKLLNNLNDKYEKKKKEINDSIFTVRHDINNYSNIINGKEFESKETSNKIIETEVTINNINLQIEELNKIISNDKVNESNTEVYLNNLRYELDDINNRLDVINKINTLIKRDFRGYLLSNIIEFISNKIKLYSVKVFGSDNFSFTLDGNNILISYDNKEYESLSGGEKQKADVIIQLAIRDMLCNYLNFSSNILVLDEITDSLDIVGSQNILDLISKELVDVEAIYIISHHSDFDIPWDEEIKVVKGNDKISRII